MSTRRLATKKRRSFPWRRGWLAAALARRGGTLGKVLGSLTYDRALPGAPGAYQLWDNRQAVKLTEGGERA